LSRKRAHGAWLHAPCRPHAMGFQLAPTLSFGLMDDGAVVLDLAHDRYRRLTPALTLALMSLGVAKAERDLHPFLVKLVAAGILVEAPVSRCAVPVMIERTTSSAIETDTRAASRTPGRGLVIGALLRARAELAALGLARTVARARAYRLTTPLAPAPETAVAFAQTFGRHQILSPLARSCVPNALALSRLLGSANIAHDLIFGVRLAPFTAHAWVQTDTHILSDTVGFASVHLPVFRL
jgi:hypothetical protein